MRNVTKKLHVRDVQVDEAKNILETCKLLEKNGLAPLEQTSPLGSTYLQ